ncbi:Uncharacterised protein [Candidatus Bartonella washoeensis]|uniref:Uncharacterized protein n=2 Tax=Candidatus Bartonella washoeensis TaxID=186739 RepID=J0QHU2_9HYPH|nr:hypothetical protein MCQ_00851 [Bartonella washoeensis Sb944nv]EJF85086.1 hypothetical protein MCW_00972 [Bartonella washoeensis 085-0475]SPU26635.1 Uncharacterised protein [Bartonella washoeensis]
MIDNLPEDKGTTHVIELGFLNTVNAFNKTTGMVINPHAYHSNLPSINSKSFANPSS